MPPTSMHFLEEVADLVVEEFFPDQVIGPGQLDVLHLVDFVLPQCGIEVYPVSAAELNFDAEAVTDWEGTGPIIIRLREDLWKDLSAGGRQANRAKSTVMHEVSHAILHVHVLRESATREPMEALLNRRIPRQAIKPFVDPEWQAHALCGCMLAPRRHIEALMAEGLSLDQMADRLGISVPFLRSHLKRLKMQVQL